MRLKVCSQLQVSFWSSSMLIKIHCFNNIFHWGNQFLQTIKSEKHGEKTNYLLNNGLWNILKLELDCYDILPIDHYIGCSIDIWNMLGQYSSQHQSIHINSTSPSLCVVQIRLSRKSTSGPNCLMNPVMQVKNSSKSGLIEHFNWSVK